MLAGLAAVAPCGGVFCWCWAVRAAQVTHSRTGSAGCRPLGDEGGEGTAPAHNGQQRDLRVAEHSFQSTEASLAMQEARPSRVPSALTLRAESYCELGVVTEVTPLNALCALFFRC